MTLPPPEGAAVRPVGISSMLHRASGATRIWTATEGTQVPLPLLVDVVETAPDGQTLWSVSATVDLREGEPTLIAVHVECIAGLDPRHLQQEFRWATPLEIVTRIVPRLIAQGRDPFAALLPFQGFPDASRTGNMQSRRLSDDFLEDIANAYLDLGRGYSRQLAQKYCVSERTVISWVQKARSRGILSPARPGRVGGEVRSAARRTG